jgi:hypothetical protein
MKNKKNIIFIASLLVLLALILLAIFIIKARYNSFNNTNLEEVRSVLEEDGENRVVLYEPENPMTEEEKSILGLSHLGIYDVLTRDDEGSPVEYQRVGLEKPRVIDEIDWMTDKEKRMFGLLPEKRVQVLNRGGEGQILAWRLIKKDSDIITVY